MGKLHYVVQGRGDFPIDMLRYDDCDFASDAERAAALGTLTPSTHTPGRRCIALVSEIGRRPTPGRWESFGWTVHDADSGTARLDRHRRANSILPEGHVPPKPAALEAAEDRLRTAAALVSQALIDVEQIRDRPPQGLYPTYRNELERHRDKRPFNMKDARYRATVAARMLREAWEILDPSA